jgi:hypothetical protein
MGIPTSTESAALSESGPLERFAAERIPNLDPSLTLSIAQAHVDAESQQWTPAASQSFWIAFNKLCLLIQPTTLDCLAASTINIDQRVWLTGKRRMVSLAQQSSGRYLVALLISILVAVPLQLYVWGGTIESKRIDESLDHLQHSSATLVDDFQRLDHDAPQQQGDKLAPAWSPELVARSDKLVQSATDFERDLDRLDYQTGILRRLTSAQVAAPNDVVALPKDSKWYEYYEHAMGRYGSSRLAAIRAQEEAGLEVGVVLSFVLPLLFGIIGAIAYVVRTISNEISTSTFSRTSPTRHLMRVTLGALSGVVVGFFTNLANQVALSPLALAFLAGYGVEAFFSMFDGFIAKFKA